jgi:fatty-acid desaturase
MVVLLKNKLVVFTLKRALFLYPVALIICIIFATNKLSAFIGLTVGAVLSVLRLYLSTEVMGRLNASTEREGSYRKHSTVKLVILQLINQFLILPLLFFAYLISKNFFAGFIAGVFIVPLVFMINSITEALGLTNNNFE